MPRSRTTTILGVVAAIGIVFAAGYGLGFRAGSPGYRLSPMDTIAFSHPTIEASITYSRPYARGRKVFGEVVRFGRIWRTGANEATTLTTSTGMQLGGLSIDPGSYTLYTLPDAERWTLIVNRQTGQWGTEYDEDRDLGRIGMTPGVPDSFIEQLTLRFAEEHDQVELVLEWESTQARVAVSPR